MDRTVASSCLCSFSGGYVRADRVVRLGYLEGGVRVWGVLDREVGGWGGRVDGLASGVPGR